ncbi:MAG: hypothetical protein P4L50_03130 [Anaerolineaceae bacterium]|nr:hypothetical protein [Anaerolineaceae bacterium]
MGERGDNGYLEFEGTTRMRKAASQPPAQHEAATREELLNARITIPSRLDLVNSEIP